VLWPVAATYGGAMDLRATATSVGDLKTGEMTVVDVKGVRIAVANVEGRLHAFDDTCTHEQCSLAEGTLDGTTVVCPCHGAEFDVRTGAVLAPPAVEPLRTYPVRLEHGQLVIDA
jgi:3-phenylpropionate/trans-cinnamate dioxygenase ferredoxin subunit